MDNELFKAGKREGWEYACNQAFSIIAKNQDKVKMMEELLAKKKEFLDDRNNW